MSAGSREATFAASFGLREILSASGFETTGVVPVVVVDDSLVVLPVPELVLVSVEPVVVSLAADVVEYLEAFASPLALFASALAIFASAFVPFASTLVLLAVVFDAFTSTFVAGFVDVVVGPPVVAGLIELPPCAFELPWPEVDFTVGEVDGFVGFDAAGAVIVGLATVAFAGLTPFGPAISRA